MPLGLTPLPLLLLHSATLRAGRAAGIRGGSGVIALTASVTATYAVVATVVALLARTDAVRPCRRARSSGRQGWPRSASGSGAVRATGAWSGCDPSPAATGAHGTARRHRRPRHLDRRWRAAGGRLASRAPRPGDAARRRARRRHRRRRPARRALPAVRPDRRGLGHFVRRRAGVRGRRRAPRCPWAGPTSARCRPSRCSPALPQEPGPAWAPLVLVVPLLAGVLAALLAHRSARRRGAGWRPLVETSAAAGGLVAAAVAGLTLLASGPAGPGRLVETGPTGGRSARSRVSRSRWSWPRHCGPCAAVPPEPAN